MTKNREATIRHNLKTVKRKEVVARRQVRHDRDQTRLAGLKAGTSNA
jgi:hypothetical protein